MSKIDRQKKREKARAAFKAAVQLAPIKRPEAQSRDGNGRFSRPKEDPMRTALNSRCLRFGLSPNAENREICRSPWMCCDIGFVIEARTSGRDHMHRKSRLWDVFARWCRAEATYRARYLGQVEAPASAALQMVPDAVETDPSATVDTRDQDQRDRDAVNNWMRWQGFLGRLSADARTLLQCARRGDGPPLWRDGQPTDAGLRALVALVELSEVADG